MESRGDRAFGPCVATCFGARVEGSGSGHLFTCQNRLCDSVAAIALLSK